MRSYAVIHNGGVGELVRGVFSRNKTFRDKTSFSPLVVGLSTDDCKFPSELPPENLLATSKNG